MGLVLATGAANADDFYTDRLQAGDRAFKDKNFHRAIDEYRVACFGFLDDPPRLEEALMRLTVSENAAGQLDEVDATLARFLKVEKKIPSLDHVSIEPEIRDTFFELLRKRVPERALAEVPTVVALLAVPARAPAPENPKSSTASAPPPEEAAAPPPPPSPPPPSSTTTSASAAEPPAEQEPPPPPPRAAPAPPPPVAQPPAEQTVPPPTPNVVPPPPARETRPSVEAELAEARRDVLAGKSADAEKRLARLVADNPARRDARIALLEAACLIKEWKVAVAQVRVLSPLHDGEEPSMFYAAVALYESGAKDEARVFMQKAEPRITRTRYTEYYINRILSR